MSEIDRSVASSLVPAVVEHAHAAVATVHHGPPPAPHTSYAFVGYRSMMVNGEMRQVREFVSETNPAPAEFEVLESGAPAG